MDNLDCKIMYIFPGQGSQYVGMGSDIYEKYETAKSIYIKASEILGYDIAELSFKDPENKLNYTRYTQPALLTHSLACLEVFKDLTDHKIDPWGVAGHSLGEYCALVTAGTLTFEDALKLVQKRGELMSEYGRGKMLALTMDRDTVKSFIDDFYCGIGGCNLPEQTVVGGKEEDLQAVAEFVSQTYRKRSTMLNTEGAFHTYLMVEAAEKYRPFLESIEFKNPKIKVLSNYTGEYHDANDPAKIKAYLFFQLFNPVKWIWNMQQALKDGVHTIIEFGGGIGKGETPAEKRPNLAGITNKAIKGSKIYGRYLPAINVATIDRASRVESGVDDNWYYLLLPVDEDQLHPAAEEYMQLITKLDLVPVVQIIPEPVDINLQSLKKVDSSVTEAQPCLLELVGSETDALLVYYKDDISKTLQELHNHLLNSGYHYST